MAKKYNNESVYFADWTTAKLKSEARSYDQMIYEVQCYGTSDLRMLDGILAELDRRGVQSHRELAF